MRPTMIALLLGLASPALAAGTEAARLQTVLASRLELQRSLRADLEGTLGTMLAPHRVLVTVEAKMDARIRENVRTEETPGTEVNVRPMRQVELPGLPVVRQQIVGAGTPQMEYKVPGRKVTERTSTVDAELTGLTVRVFLDAAVSEGQRAEVKRTVLALTGLDTARGDVFELGELPSAAARPWFERVPPTWFYSLTGILGALIVALGVSRRQGGGGEVHVGAADSAGRGGAGEQERESSDGITSAAPTVAALVGGPFAALSTCSPDELVGVAAELSDTDAAVLLAAISVDPRAARRVFELSPPARQLALGQWVGAKHVLVRAEVDRVAGLASEALAKVRSRVTLGGADQLASLLAEAPEDTLKRLLEQLAERDPALAAELRQRMPFFDDLERLDAPVIRSVVTQLDPGLLAIALAGSTPGLRDRVYQAVSKRLRSILQREGEGLATPAPEQTEGARRQVELVMRRLRVQKPLVPATAS